MDYYGVGSLVAVELRSWFIKNRDADVAILYLWWNQYLATISDRGEQDEVLEDISMYSRGFEWRWRRRIKRLRMKHAITDSA